MPTFDDRSGGFPRGLELLHDPGLNKGTAFTAAEREALGLQGLLPPRISTQQQQVDHVIYNVRRKPNPLEKYLYLIGLQDRNEQLFYKALVAGNVHDTQPFAVGHVHPGEAKLNGDSPALFLFQPVAVYAGKSANQ